MVMRSEFRSRRDIIYCTQSIDLHTRISSKTKRTKGPPSEIAVINLWKRLWSISRSHIKYFGPGMPRVYVAITRWKTDKINEATPLAWHNNKILRSSLNDWHVRRNVVPTTDIQRSLHNGIRSTGPLTTSIKTEIWIVLTLKFDCRNMNNDHSSTNRLKSIFNRRTCDIMNHLYFDDTV